jgi:hypothetical protein
MPVAIQLEGLLREVLGAHEDPAAGGVVYDAFAPEAPIYLNAPLLGQLVPTPGLPALIDAAIGGSPLTWRADALVLYRSHLGAPAVRHETLARLPLGPDLPSGHAGG